MYTVEYYSAIKINEIMSFASKWMKLEIIMLSEVNQVQKDNGCIFSCFLSYVDRSKRQMYTQI
jgi:hypothetical protein